MEEIKIQKRRASQSEVCSRKEQSAMEENLEVRVVQSDDEGIIKCAISSVWEEKKTKHLSAD